MSEEKGLPTPLFHYLYKVFQTKGIERNFTSPDVLHVTNTARRVLHDQLFQDLWRTYFKAICIKERMKPKKQLSDMPRRYWKYMTEKQ